MPETIQTCQIHKKHSWIDCQNPAWPGDPQGLCILHSRDKDKNPTDFKAALKARWQQADQASYDFRFVFFPGPFDPKDFFESQEFTKAVDFWGATFTERAIFRGVTFTERAVFESATFTEEAGFHAAIFTKEAGFRGATFMKEADFFAATFMRGASFFGATFKKSANFFGAAISDQIMFHSVNPNGEPFEGDLRYLRFNPQATMLFQDLSLAWVQLSHNDLRRVEFRHVQWHPYRGRQAIYDEFWLGQRELSFSKMLVSNEYAEMERLYRNLKLNYEGAGDFKNAGDFHYGEMEMHRRASKWRWFPFYWYNLYWLLSGYGERPSRALGWLAGFLLALPLLVWGFGLDSVAGGTTPGFLETLTYIFEKATFQRPLPLSNLNLWGSFISNLSLLIIPGQAALFLLALRNRLGRRR